MIRPPGRRTRRTIEGSIAGMRIRKACRKQGGRRRDQGTRCARLLTQVKTCKEAREEVFANVSTGADTEANNSGGGALQLLEHAVLLDAARYDDGGGDAEPLLREVDPLGRLRALELVDLKRVTVDTAKGRDMLCVNGR